jgi:hypothetical protein
MRASVGFVLSNMMCISSAFAIDAWQLVREEVCDKQNISAEKAAQLSFFQFQREEGFECASKALKALENELSSSPQAKLDSSRILWSLFAATKVDSSRDLTFRSITSAIRLSDNHPLRGEARLAQVRLSVLRGRLESDFFPQLDSILADLNLVPDPRGLSKLYSDGTTGLREALRWLFAARARARAASGNEPLELRLRSLAHWAQQLALLGATEPELLQFTVADAWKRGARLISSGNIPDPASSNALPGVSGVLDYSLCASGQCQQQAGVAISAVSDQLVEKKTGLDVTNAYAAIRYGIGSNPIIQGSCSANATNCASESNEETGRHYWLFVNSAVTGGAAWKDSFWKKVKGTDDRYSEVSYKLIATFKLPPCSDPASCPVYMYARAALNGSGNEAGAVRSIQIKHPNGAKTSLSNDDLITLDRSAGGYEFAIELGLGHGERGSTASGNSSLAGLTLMSAAKLSKTFVDGAKSIMDKEGASLGRYLPLLLASRALLLRPEVFANAPDYMGLGEALGQYSDSNPTNRWDRVYLPLYFINLVRNEVGAELLPLERQGIELTGKVLSRNAKLNFQQAIDQQIELLKALQPAVSTALIDGAILAIQKGEPLDTAIDPFLAAVLSASTTDSISGASVAKAQELISKARLHDNLLDAVLLLYQARERMMLANERIGFRLELLSIERTGYSLP